MATVHDVNLRLTPPDVHAGNVTPILNVSSNLRFTQEEVDTAERFEVQIEIWGYDWDGDPVLADRARNLSWAELLVSPPKPVLRFTWTTTRFPFGRTVRDHLVVVAREREQALDESYTVPPAAARSLDEDPGVTDWSNPRIPPMWHGDEVYAIVAVRSERRTTAPSGPVSVRTGKPIP